VPVALVLTFERRVEPTALLGAFAITMALECVVELVASRADALGVRALEAPAALACAPAGEWPPPEQPVSVSEQAVRPANTRTARAAVRSGALSSVRLRSLRTLLLTYHRTGGIPQQPYLDDSCDTHKRRSEAALLVGA
jgi:hypothetical protein